MGGSSWEVARAPAMPSCNSAVYLGIQRETPAGLDYPGLRKAIPPPGIQPRGDPGLRIASLHLRSARGPADRSKRDLRGGSRFAATPGYGFGSQPHARGRFALVIPRVGDAVIRGPRLATWPGHH